MGQSVRGTGLGAEPGAQTQAQKPAGWARRGILSFIETGSRWHTAHGQHTAQSHLQAELASGGRGSRVPSSRGISGGFSGCPVSQPFTWAGPGPAGGRPGDLGPAYGGLRGGARV